ncbi:MAG TPA: hypothetical protein DDZ39_08185 [Flavobacteriaceae bacterium]|nr:hypothetical protein [Flavobacteriaceae bacterium]
MEKQKLPNSTLVLVMGILSIIGCCCYGVPGIIFGIIALVVGNNSIKVYNESPENYLDPGNVKTGRIMGIIGLILSVLFIIYLVWGFYQLGLTWEELQDQELLQERMEELKRQQ